MNFAASRLLLLAFCGESIAINGALLVFATPPTRCEIYEELWQKIPSLPERVATGSKSEAGTQGKKAGEDGARPFVEAFPFLFGLEKRATVPAAQHYRGTVTSVTEHTVTVQMTEVLSLFIDSFRPHPVLACARVRAIFSFRVDVDESYIIKCGLRRCHRTSSAHERGA